MPDRRFLPILHDHDRRLAARGNGLEDRDIVELVVAAMGEKGDEPFSLRYSRHQSDPYVRGNIVNRDYIVHCLSALEHPTHIGNSYRIKTMAFNGKKKSLSV